MSRKNSILGAEKWEEMEKWRKGGGGGVGGAGQGAKPDKDSFTSSEYYLLATKLTSEDIRSV